jgi:ATP-dependent DNA helicase RecG
MEANLEARALKLLEASLKPLPHEKNEIDWKSNLSDDSKRLAQHLSAFANCQGGGFFAFGVTDNGSPVGIADLNYPEIIKKLGDIARNNLVGSVIIDHAILIYNSVEILFVYVKESQDRPVHLRSGTIYDSYIRSGCQTRKMTRGEVARLIATSEGISFETESAGVSALPGEVRSLLDIESFFELLARPFPEDLIATTAALEDEGMLKSVGSEIEITNLGAILFAKDLTRFAQLKRKPVRVIIYKNTDRLDTIKEQVFTQGYASGFDLLVNYVNDQLPRGEVIDAPLRKDTRVYPELAVRELIANALIHQDFAEMGTGVMIEIFSDRLEITNPGRPIINTIRFIDLPPQSRNEAMASFMRRINICEERGSGIDKVIRQVEHHHLPAPQFVGTSNHTRVTLFSPRPLNKMDRDDKIRACYQHCCLQYASNSRMTNQSLRERFSILEKNYSTVSRIIADTIEAKLVKPAATDSKSKKFATYLPFWA